MQPYKKHLTFLFNLDNKEVFIPNNNPNSQVSRATNESKVAFCQQFISILRQIFWEVFLIFEDVNSQSWQNATLKITMIDTEIGFIIISILFLYMFSLENSGLYQVRLRLSWTILAKLPRSFD